MNVWVKHFFFSGRGTASSASPLRIDFWRAEITNFYLGSSSGGWLVSRNRVRSSPPLTDNVLKLLDRFPALRGTGELDQKIGHDLGRVFHIVLQPGFQNSEQRIGVEITDVAGERNIRSRYLGGDLVVIKSDRVGLEVFDEQVIDIQVFEYLDDLRVLFPDLEEEVIRVRSSSGPFRLKFHCSSREKNCSKTISIKLDSKSSLVS